MKSLAKEGFKWNPNVEEVGELGSGDMVYERGFTKWDHEDSTKQHRNK